MKFIFQATSSSEYCDDVDYALVTITPEDAKKIIDRHRVLQEVKSRGGVFAELDMLYFQDVSPEWFPASRLGEEGLTKEELERDQYPGLPDLLTSEQRSALDNQEVVKLADDFNLYAADDSDTVQTYADHLVLCESSFWWQAYIEHSGVHIETWSFPYNLLNHII